MVKTLNNYSKEKPPHPDKRWGLLIEWWQTKNPIFRFLIVVLFLTIFFYALILPSAFFQNNFYPGYINLNAKISGYIISLFFKGVSIHESIIKLPDFSISLKKGCEALEPTLLFIAGVVAFPASLFKKSVGVFFGIVVIFIINLIRIINLFFIGRNNSEVFYEFHIYVWPAFFIFLAIILWVIWLKWVIKTR